MVRNGGPERAAAFLGRCCQATTKQVAEGTDASYNAAYRALVSLRSRGLVRSRWDAKTGELLWRRR